VPKPCMGGAQGWAVVVLPSKVEVGGLYCMLEVIWLNSPDPSTSNTVQRTIRLLTENKRNSL